MLYDDGSFGTREFTQYSLSDSVSFFDSHKNLNTHSYISFDRFFGSSRFSSSDHVCEITTDAYHIVMCASRRGYTRRVWFEIVICDIHPADKGSALTRELIEEEYFRVIIFSAIYEAEW